LKGFFVVSHIVLVRENLVL